MTTQYIDLYANSWQYIVTSWRSTGSAKSSNGSRDLSASLQVRHRALIADAAYHSPLSEATLAVTCRLTRRTAMMPTTVATPGDQSTTDSHVVSSSDLYRRRSNNSITVSRFATSWLDFLLDCVIYTLHSTHTLFGLRVRKNFSAISFKYILSLLKRRKQLENLSIEPIVWTQFKG